MLDPDATQEAVLPERGRSRPAFRREPLDALPRFDWGDFFVESLTRGLGPRRADHGWDSRAQRLSSIRVMGQKVAEPPKSSVPAAKTFAPAGVS